ncbi:thiol:disulfide interchange protein DsbG [Pandoraea sp. NPDC087047]|uniref:thiol:disulfide interchange protein DsbG n=1 Tax=Pandoraea sp. NPDC087047 TaxID=3364390 RepID=UPI00381EC8B9
MLARKFLVPALIVVPVLAAVAYAVASGKIGGAGNATPSDSNTPSVLRALAREGLQDLQPFDAGAHVRGYAGRAGQQPVAVYVLPDGSAIVGARISVDGKPLDDERVSELVAKPMGETLWAKLDASTWVQDGNTDAPRVVYTFSDPNCRYCHRFWDAARPWVDSGKVQLRHVMVGVIKVDSSTKAAAILGASDRAAALRQHEREFESGGIKPAPSVPSDIALRLDANQDLMAELGFRGTPGIVYLDAQGTLARVNGMPRPEMLATVLGPR